MSRLVHLPISRCLPKYTLISSRLYSHHNTVRTTLFSQYRNKSGVPLTNLVLKMENNQVLRSHALKLFNQGVESVLPKTMVQRALAVEGSHLVVDDEKYRLDRNVYVAAFGKAVLGMAAAAEEILGDHIVQGVASVPVGIQNALRENGRSDHLPAAGSRIGVYEGAMGNIPDEAALRSAEKINKMVSGLGEEDILLVLISGGGSALLALPTPPITLTEMQEVTTSLQRHGATIHQLNTLRKNMEVLKGGGLGGLAKPAKVVSLILSDVIGDELDIIASGPTVSDHSTPQQCLDLLKMLDIRDPPASVLSHLGSEANEMVISTIIDDSGKNRALMDDVFAEHGPKPQHDCSHVQNVIVGSNEIAVRTIYDEALELGYMPTVLSTKVQGDAVKTGEMLAKIAKFVCDSFGNKMNQAVGSAAAQAEIQLVSLGLKKESVNRLVELAGMACNTGKPVCIITAGETTVNVKGTGKGGRNQEIALAAAIEFDKFQKDNPAFAKFNIQLLSAGTDGQDGPTEAAGALADPYLVANGNSEGFNAQEYLENNDSFTFFNLTNDGQDLVVTGLTGTNVMDIQIMLIQPLSGKFSPIKEKRPFPTAL